MSCVCVSLWQCLLTDASKHSCMYDRTRSWTAQHHEMLRTDCPWKRQELLCPAHTQLTWKGIDATCVVIICSHQHRLARRS